MQVNPAESSTNGPHGRPCAWLRQSRVEPDGSRLTSVLKCSLLGLQAIGHYSILCGHSGAALNLVQGQTV